MCAHENREICSLVVCHEKDADTLGFCIRGVLESVRPSCVYVVGSSAVSDLVRGLPAVCFLHEDEVIEGVTAGLHDDPRWGWYFQQILKLGFSSMSPTSRYLVVDADTVFLRPVELQAQGDALLYGTACEYHQPYFDAFEELLGFPAIREHSFITHHMVFDSAIVQEMLGRFRPMTPWWRNVERYLQPREPWNSGAQFSEYETYGHYVKAVHPQRLVIRPLRWTVRERVPTQAYVRWLSKRFDFCTFHAHLRSSARLARMVRDLARDVLGR